MTRRCRYGTAVALLLMCRPASGLWALTPNEILDKLDQAQQKTKTLSGEMEENVAVRGTLQSQSLSGRLIWENPNKIFLQFDKPTPETFVCDGKTLWIYLPALNQAMRQDMNSSELLKQFQFQLGAEVRDMRERFAITPAGEETLDGSLCHILKLVPRRSVKSKSYFEVKLWISEALWLPVKSMAYTINGTVVSMRLKKLKTNPAVKEELFTFHPPAGVEVIDGFLMMAPSPASEALTKGKTKK